MKNEKGIARLSLVITVGIIVVLSVGILLDIYIKNYKKQKLNIENSSITENIDNTDKEQENKQKKESETEKQVNELVFDEDFIKSGEIFGNVSYSKSYVDNSVVISITGNSDNNIDEVNFVSTKNRWYKKVDLTDYTTLEVYARNGGTGDVMICIDDTIVERVRYTDVPSAWTKYKVDVSKYKGEHTIALAGGYADRTGSEDSNTQYKGIVLK